MQSAIPNFAMFFAWWRFCNKVHLKHHGFTHELIDLGSLHGLQSLIAYMVLPVLKGHRELGRLRLLATGREVERFARLRGPRSEVWNRPWNRGKPEHAELKQSFHVNL